MISRTSSHWLIAALLLPFLVLGAAIWHHHSNLSKAQEWRIPITGYDPRDLLRGHYIRFNYDWVVSGNPAQCNTAEGCAICLNETTGHITAEITTPDTKCRFKMDPKVSEIRIFPGSSNENSHFHSRIFVSESSAPKLEEKLRTVPMEVVAMLGPDGRLVNRRLQERTPTN